jgi:hypothetical protein
MMERKKSERPKIRAAGSIRPRRGAGTPAADILILEEVTRAGDIRAVLFQAVHIPMRVEGFRGGAAGTRLRIQSSRRWFILRER